MTYKLLDLYCGAGGAGYGYHLAGFDVTGVDIANQPNYPFDFVQSDAIEYVEKYGHLYDAIHASPPCQHYTAISRGTNKNKYKYADLIDPTRKALQKFEFTVIENVLQAPLRQDLMLCGEMFSLKTLKHRIFECSFDIKQPEHVPHKGKSSTYDPRRGGKTVGYYYSIYGTGGSRGTKQQWMQAMQMPWVKYRKELTEAIPPAYTEYIGKELMNALQKKAGSD